MKLRTEFTCPLELVHDMLKGKWKQIILWRLRFQPTSPSQLCRDIVGITEKMLLEQLKELQEFELVDKKVYSSDHQLLKTEYFLTDKGWKVIQALQIFQQLGIQYMLENGQEETLLEKNLI